MRRAVVASARTRPGRLLLASALADDEVLRDVLNALSDRIAAETPFDDAVGRPASFEDCVSVLSCNQLNHGTSRMTILEASYLYRLVHLLDDPMVVEIGRYRGGTTFLLAAAGGRVLSIDNDPAVAAHDHALRRALERRELADRVTLVLADSQTYAPPPESPDVVLVDGDHRYEGVRADFAHWLPVVALGGHLLVHDGLRPDPPRPWSDPWKVEGVRRACAELFDDPRLAFVARAHTLADFVVTAR